MFRIFLCILQLQYYCYYFLRYIILLWLNIWRFYGGEGEKRSKKGLTPVTQAVHRANRHYIGLN